MVNRYYLMNILIEFIKDTIISNDKKIDKDYIYKMIINPNYSTNNTLESISDNDVIFDNWLRFFKYEKDIQVEKNSQFFSLQSNDYDEIYLNSAIKLYIPINKDKIEIAVKKIFSYIKEEKIRHCSKVFKTVRNDNIVIRVFSIDDVENIIKFVSNNDYIKSGMMDLSPFVTTHQGVGLAMDFNYSYHDILAISLYKYFEKLTIDDTLDKANIEDYKNYLINIIEHENNETLKFIYKIIIDNLNGDTDLNTIKKYYNENKLKIINNLLFDIYYIYDYNIVLELISNYESIISLNDECDSLPIFKLFITEEDYKNLIGNNYKTKLDEAIKLKTGYNILELDELYKDKKDKLYELILNTFKKCNCYQEIKLYLKEYINNVDFNYDKTWINKLDKNISRIFTINTIKKEMKVKIINDNVIEQFINKVLTSNMINIDDKSKELLKNSIKNTYENRLINKEKFIKDAIKQYILIDKINGFTNDNNCRDNVIKNIKPYECFYIVAQYYKNNYLLDDIITDYVYSIMPYLSNREFNNNEKIKFLESITENLINKKNLNFVKECLKLCCIGSTDGIIGEDKLILENCIGCNNILNIIKDTLKTYNQEILEDDDGIIIASYVDYINTLKKESIAI